MDWKRIKTIFIMTFLLLDIFLLNQLYEEITDNKFKPMVSESDEEVLKDLQYADDVKIPKVDEKFTLISAKNIGFSKDAFEKLDKQLTTKKIMGGSVQVTLHDPIPVNIAAENKEDLNLQLATFLQGYVPYGKEYRQWSISEDGHSIIFTQLYNNRPIYYDYSKINTIPHGTVELILNNKGEITGYHQSYLLISKQGNEQKIIPAEEALIKLYNYGYIKQDSVVEDIDLGYFSLISIENIQVFSPTWHIQIDGQYYMVNGIDGTVTEYTETE